MVKKVDTEWMEKARRRQDVLTKPQGSLGALEEAGVRLAAIQKTERPSVGRGAVVVCAADHGVALSGVSAFPREVTVQMVANFAAGGAAINQIARSCDADVVVLDVGVDGPASLGAGVVAMRVRPGSGHIANEPAMSRAEVESAIDAGRHAARRAIEGGATILAAGDMGIGNTTPAAALASAYLGLSAAETTGRGTGIDEETRQRKVAVVEAALARARRALGELTIADPIDVLAHLGGLELAAIAGVYLEGARAGLPLVADGFPVTSGALAATRIEPGVRDYLFAGHQSVEPGHAHLLRALDLRPLLRLELRLGEGTGAVLAFPVLRAAAAVLAGMATFAEAGVSAG